LYGVSSKSEDSSMPRSLQIPVLQALAPLSAPGRKTLARPNVFRPAEALGYTADLYCPGEPRELYMEERFC
jgi:hypothetical protein